MKTFALKSFILATSAVVMALSFTSASAQTSARSASVTLKAIVPEYIGLTIVNSAPVVFDFTGYQDRLSNADKSLYFAAMGATVPTWTLNYNLNKRTVTVCAYATDLQGTGNNRIQSKYIAGQSVQDTGVPFAYFGAVNVCSDMAGHAMLLDTIKNAGSSVNTFGTTPRLEGFKLLQLPGSPDGKTVPTPDTYTGSLYIVAQAI